MPYKTTEIEALRLERRELGEKMRALLDKPVAEKRAETPEESAQFDAMQRDAERLKTTVERMELVDGLTADVPSKRSAPAFDDVDPEDAPPAGREVAKESRRVAELIRRSPRDTKEYRAAFSQFCEADGRRANAAFDLAAKALERRDLQADKPTQAGVLMPPMQWVSELLQDLAYPRTFRSKARTFQIGAARSLGAPRLTTRLSTWAWGSELAAPTNDTALAFGKRELYPHDATGGIKVSRPWLEGALMAPEQILREEMARDGGELQENAFWAGDGNGKPLGVFTASSDGISTSRDVTSGNTNTAMTDTGLVNAKYTLKTPYWDNLEIVTSRAGHKQIYQMKDGDGRPLFVESLRVGDPDLIHGMRLSINEFVPQTFTTGLYVAIIGDFRWYWIADALNITLQRLDELYAATNQVGFIARMKTDGMPVLEEAFARVKLA